MRDNLARGVSRPRHVSFGPELADVTFESATSIVAKAQLGESGCDCEKEARWPRCSRTRPKKTKALKIAIPYPRIRNQVAPVLELRMGLSAAMQGQKQRALAIRHGAARSVGPGRMLKERLLGRVPPRVNRRRSQ